MISVHITAVGPGKISFSVDGSGYTVSISPKLKLVDQDGKTIQCANFNEWFAQRTMGFFMAHHLHAMADAFQDGAKSGARREDLKSCAQAIFDLVKESLFQDGLACYYADQYPRCVASKEEIMRLVNAAEQFASPDLGRLSPYFRICRARGYTQLAERLEKRGVTLQPQQKVVSQVGDVIINQRISQYLNG